MTVNWFNDVKLFQLVLTHVLVSFLSPCAFHHFIISSLPLWPPASTGGKENLQPQNLHSQGMLKVWPLKQVPRGGIGWGFEGEVSSTPLGPLVRVELFSNRAAGAEEIQDQGLESGIPLSLVT